MSKGEGRVIFEDQIDQIGEIQRDLGRFATHFARKQTIAQGNSGAKKMGNL